MLSKLNVIKKNKSIQGRNRKLLIMGLISLLILIMTPIPSAIAAENGQVLFEQNCAGCHTLDGTGKGFAPDLKGVTERREKNWLVNWIAAPDKMIENGDPIAQEIVAKYNGVPMPNMGLTTEQSQAIVDYLAGNNDQALTNSDQNIAQQIDNSHQVNLDNQTTEIDQNNVAMVNNSQKKKGEDLFLGKTRFANKAPACNSCHSAGIGALNGGTLGPNLTHVFGRYGEMGLGSVLKTLPYPSMQGIYQNKPLTDDEQTALLAFLKQQDSVSNEPVKTDNLLTNLTPTIKLVLIALGGCLFLLIVSNWTWADRFTGVRQKMVEGEN